MQRWLYWFASFEYTQKRWRLHSENEAAQADWRKKGPTLFDYLNDLGNKGWELAAAVSTDDDRLSLILKKHRSD